MCGSGDGRRARRRMGITRAVATSSVMSSIDVFVVVVVVVVAFVVVVVGEDGGF